MEAQIGSGSSPSTLADLLFSLSQEFLHAVQQPASQASPPDESDAQSQQPASILQRLLAAQRDARNQAGAEDTDGAGDSGS